MILYRENLSQIITNTRNKSCYGIATHVFIYRFTACFFFTIH
ncbi:PQ-loop domain-containing transporter [Pseudoalteromonas xiamenensis]